jgi:acyl-coenzyme A thioesterase PaaI-like protein
VAVLPLDNATWGFESNCFVCEPKNSGGLRIPFFHDEEAGTVFAEYTLDETFSGAPSYVHGGVTLAVLDEAMAWATIAVGKAFALTAKTSTEFRRPMRIGSTYRVEARILDRHDAIIEVAATITNRGGNPCAEAVASFHAMDAAQAKEAIGTEATGNDAGYVRG